MALFDFLRKTSPRDRFAKAAVERLKQRGWPYPLSYRPDKFLIELGLDGAVLNLENAVLEWETYPPAERKAALDTFVQAAFDLLEREPTFEEAIPLLFPIIRNQADLFCNEWAGALEGSRATPPPFAPVVGPLVMLAVVDRPQSMSYVTAGLLKEWGRSFEEVRDLAVANLRAQAAARFRREEPGFYVSDYGDYHDPSRILTPEVLGDLPIRGDPIAVAVSRICLLVAGSEEPAALEAMAGVAASFFRDDSRPISCLPIVLRKGQWLPIDRDGPEPAPLRRLVVDQALRDDGIQTQLLEAYLENQGRPARVSPLNAFDHDGRPVTWAAWEEGAPVLLPRADLLVLEQSEGAPLIRPWEAVAEVCGFSTEPEVYPHRFRPAGWPDAGRWSELDRVEGGPAAARLAARLMLPV